MDIRGDSGKNVVILNDEEVIIKGFFKDKVIKREDILSACLLENLGGNKGIVILTKDYKVIEKRRVNMRWSDREKLKFIVDEINTNDTLFDYSCDKNRYWYAFYYPYLVCLIFNSFIFDEEYILKWTGALLCIALIIIMIIYFSRVNYFKGVVYNSSKEKFYIVRRKNKIVKEFDINDIEIDRKFKHNIYRYKVKDSKYKFIMKKYLISYPTEYERIVDQVKNTALKNSH